MRYNVKRTEVVNPAIDSAEWDKAEVGKLTGHSHFASWSPVETTDGDFHLSDFFFIDLAEQYE